ncbi:MAG: LysM peptidoglycan-binding domain-containing protein [Candidatus Zixiibacteriota bacterium]|nr:MAG: LysM peptidoglycan-binding domain-containing protein [candidate division Zixibacteria bacterium]
MDEKAVRILRLSLLAVVAISSFLYFGCSGKGSMKSPQVYGAKSSAETDSAEVTRASAEDDTSGLGDVLSDASSTAPDSVAVSAFPSDATEDSVSAEDAFASDPQDYELIEGAFYDAVDIQDSASAVDDDLWRQFDLAHEYHAMGVLANREASWEEAQYYFEKALRILANLDIEADSTLTPESKEYNGLLDNIIADYRVTLRSLGSLDEDVSPAVLIERFGELADRLGADSLVVYNGEEQPITYDIPITMNSRVKSSIVYYQGVGREVFKKFLTRSKRYTSMMKRILAEYGLPQDLIYLSMVESGYNPHAYSWARAMGLWQFISSTGRRYGLARSWWIDERKDPIKSTHAACRFLKALYEQFGSWELAMAAYNGGPGRVSRQIKRQKTIDFWKLKLKRQTMDYVPLIMAAAVIAKNPGKYGFNDIEFEDEVVWDEVTIDKCLELSVIAKELGCSAAELKQLNPELLRKYTPPNDKKYVLKIPKGSKDKFWAAYDGMPSPKETSWVQHKIRRGETVSHIAARYGVSQYAILEANNLSRRSKIYAGKTLIVPVPLDREYSNWRKGKNTDYTAKNSIYIVRSGDTMWDIARAFGTSVSALRRANYIGRGSRIYVGQKLKIPSSAAKLKNRNVVSGGGPAYAAESGGSSSGSDANTEVKTYKVRSGDTLWDIARRFGTTTGKIRGLNGLGRSSRIYPGQILKVAGGGADYVIHKVRRGETLGSIARKYRTTVARIRANNNIDDPDLLRIGETLRIYLN